jgi:hypothetical protein
MMRFAARFILAISALMLCSTAFAQEPNMPATGPGGGSTSSGGSGSGFELGLRSGYGLPIGDAVQNGKMSDLISGMIPFWADVGYRIDPNWYVGGFYQFGLGFVPTSLSTAGCNVTGVSCSIMEHRFGLNVHYHFLPDQNLDPWVGIGAGYEIYRLSASAQGLTASASFSGFEFGNAQLGLDYKVSRAFGIGPFVMITIAQYSNASASVAGQDIPVPAFNKTIHEWLIFGLRGVFDFGVD